MAVRNGKLSGDMMVRLRGTAEETNAQFWSYSHPETQDSFSILFQFQEIKRTVNSRYKVNTVYRRVQSRPA
jgi:hypothetical protein